MNSFDEDLEFSLEQAYKIAEKSGHEYVTTEHLLSVLLSNNQAAQEVLNSCGANIERLRDKLAIHLKQSGHITKLHEKSISQEIIPTVKLHQVIQKTIAHSQASGRIEKKASGADILVSLLMYKDTFSAYYLQQENINRLSIVRYLAHEAPKKTSQRKAITTAPIHTKESIETTESLPRFFTDLTQKARDGDISPLIGRQEEVNRIIAVLSRRIKNNAILVGDAGVGKTVLVHGLALKIIQKQVPDGLINASVYSLDIGNMMAGARYRGDFEERLQLMIQYLKHNKRSILFIDEIHNIVGTGATTNSGLDLSNIIKPILEIGMRCIGATTYKEYRKVIENDQGLSRRFLKIDIHEPSVKETVQILNGIVYDFEKYHNVKYTKSALEKAVYLSDRYIKHRSLPDKAIDLLDEAAILPLSIPSSVTRKSKRRTITEKDITITVVRAYKIPINIEKSSERTKLQTIDKQLKKLIYGQDHAIEQITSAIKMNRAGLGSEQQPIGSFLFAGPTGVGKTELSIQLAKIMNMPIVRIDMSEYMEKHAVSGLIGAPPGYIGHEQGGKLTSAIEKHPYAVVLLDEIEKAHVDIFNILLQIMDYGMLTDSVGKQVNFRNTIVIMTTNAGATEFQKNAIGFNPEDNHANEKYVIQKQFSAEFRNRLNGIIQFNRLNKNTMHAVVKKHIEELQAKLRNKKIELKLTKTGSRWFAEHGHHALMGARPLQRLIDEKIRKPLSEKIISKSVSAGDIVSVDSIEDNISLTIIKKANKNTSNTSRVKKISASKIS